MATKVIAFKKISVRNPFKVIGRRFQRDAENLPKVEAAFTRRRAKSIMKKGPKKPKSRFGNIQPYGKRSKKFGKYFWRKGLYSRPGHPPFHYGQVFNIRNQIVFGPITTSGVNIPHARTGGAMLSAYRVGPVIKKGREVPTPVPQLHEYGGTARISKRAPTFGTRNPKIRLRRTGKIINGKASLTGGTGSLHYPERPYMRPSGKEARRSSQAKHGGSLKWLVNLGGLKGKRKRV